MGKKRNTVKTGDKGLYKSRSAASGGPKGRNKVPHDDNMYDEIDRHYNHQEDLIRLDNDNGEDDLEDDGYANKEAVMDLAGGSSSSSSSSSEEDSEEEHRDDNQASLDEEEPVVSSDDDADEMEDEEDVRDWGRRKAGYWGGDTADLEIGQDQEDAFLEEEAAKQVQAARYEQMDEHDFMLSEDEQADSDKNTMEPTTRDLTKLSRAARRKLIKSHHPELLPLVSHFAQIIQNWNEKSRVVTEALFSSQDVSAQDVGATDKGLEYILTKSLLQTSTALNVAAYVLLKSEQAKKSTDMNDLKLSDDAGSEIKSHPVMARLQQLNRLQQKLEDEVEKKLPSIGEQIENLVKAAALMNEEPEESDDEEQHSQADEGGDLDSEQIHDEEPSKEKVAFSADDDAEERGHNHVDEEEMARAVLLEARFGLRPQELNSDSHTRDKQRRPAPSDFGDEEANESHSRKAYQALASTINSIQQRSVTKSHKSKRLDEDLDSQDNDELKLGLEIMEQDIGPMDEDDDDVEGDDEIDEELADGLGGSSYYDRVAKKSHMKRELKKYLYKVAPKYPGMEAEIDGERAISKAILKNRGLVAHKAKINRNPRVKKREQYRKALIRRKGKVREVRTLEGHKYGGEGTGIKTGISRSRKL